MADIPEMFRPDGLKLVLAVTLIIPLFFIIQIIPGFGLEDLLVPVILAIVFSYWVACFIDYMVESRTTKIAIASVTAVISIILGYLLVRSMNVVCDPVHDPGRIVCDPVHTPVTPAPTVITTVRPVTTTPMICDPVHVPGSCSGEVYQVTPGILTCIVAEKLDECRKKCGR